MTEILTASQMRATERAAIDAGEVTGLELMERAGHGVVEAIVAQWPELERVSRRALVLCGPGNNGGDGFVVARLLLHRGWDVEVFFFGDVDRQSADAHANLAAWSELGQPVSPIVPHRGRDMRLVEPPADLWVDALFGTGLTRPLPDEVASLIKNLYYERNWQDAPLVAVDILSGVQADTGQKLADILLAADLTVTFHATKPGHVTGAGADLSGKVVVVDIGL